MTEHLDVLIVGAGISGISAAWHLQDRSPSKTYAILERRENMGGTWDLFKYPGIRSDSDMFTLGFRFKPWTSAKAIADGPAILAYIKEAAAENGIDKNIRYGHQVTAADWSDADNRWTVTVDTGGEEITMTCSFLFATTGYYNYDEGYSPTFEGSEDFAGTIVHPQHWPEDLDYAGKKIVVIGSGATAITLIPALVNSGAGHVTMLQRSPSYVGSLPDVDPIAVQANKYLPKRVAHVVNRWKAIGFSTVQYQLARKFPKYMRKTLLTMAQRRLPEGYDVEKHFGPKYNLWDQRLCLAPNGDLFKTIRKGNADVVTDTIERFVPEGIKLTSGEVARRRHHRHRNGSEHATARRPGSYTQRPADRPDLTDDLQGPDVLGHSELRHHLRIHECVVDAEGRPGLRVRLPRAELHGRQRFRQRGARTSRRRRGRTAVHGLHSRLLPAGDRPVAEVGFAGAVAAQAELPPRPTPDPPGQGRRRGAALHQTPCARDGLVSQREQT